MIAGLLWLLGCQFVGEVLARTLHLRVPGPVIGMVLLLIVLAFRERVRADNGRIYGAADALLAHLQLYFAPAGVGVVTLLALLGAHWLPIGTALLGSWLLGLLVVGAIVQWGLRRQERQGRTGGAGRPGDSGVVS